MDLPLPNIVQKTTAIDKAMNEVQKIRAENQLADTLNTRNRPLVDLIHDLLLYSDILVWQKGNTEQTDNWTGLFKLLSSEDETCQINLPSGSTEFRSTAVKLYIVYNDDT